MTLHNLLESLKVNALKEANVNQVILYDLLEMNRPDIQYSTVVIIPDNAIVQENTIKRTFTIYYIDRLTDLNNEEYIQSVGELVLNSLLNRTLDEFDLDKPVYTINYFKHKFVDDCAGCFINITIETELETICEIQY